MSILSDNKDRTDTLADRRDALSISLLDWSCTRKLSNITRLGSEKLILPMFTSEPISSLISCDV